MKIITVILLILAFGLPSFAQQKMDLDDLNIKGELLGDDRIQMLNREKNKLQNFVEFRTNFRKEILEDLPKPYPVYLNK